MSTLQPILTEILTKRHDLSEQQVLNLIEEKKKEGRGLLSDEGAARLVAEELLIQTRSADIGRMRVADLVSGLNDVTISGRVLLSRPPQEFQRRDGTSGRIMRLVIVDRSGRANCAIWDRHVDIAAKRGDLQGRVIRIGHAYTRQGLAGDTEIHAGDRSSIEIDPEGLPETDFPQISELFTPVAKLNVDANSVSVIGYVLMEPRYYSFQKEGRAGSVLRTVIGDESGQIPVVFWNERAEEIRETKSDNILRILNARTRLDSNGRLELHVESRGQVAVLSTAPDYLRKPIPQASRILHLRELTPQSGFVDLNARLIAKSDIREVNRSSGGSVKVSSILVSDETGLATLSLWDDKAELVGQLNEGDLIEARGVSVRDRNGELQLSVGAAGQIRKTGQNETKLVSITKLEAIQNSKGLVTVEGLVSDSPVMRQVVTEKGENVDVASFTLKDDTGLARVTFWRNQASAIAQLKTGTRVRLTGLRVRPGLNGQLELSSIYLSKIARMEPEISKPAWEDIRHVIGLSPGLTTWIKGLILEFASDPILDATCETCGSQLAVEAEQFTCTNCRAIKSGKIVISGIVRVDDGTGTLQVILSKHNLSSLGYSEIDQFRNQMLRARKTSLSVPASGLLGAFENEFEMYGTAEQSDTHGKLTFRVQKIVPGGKL